MRERDHAATPDTRRMRTALIGTFVGVLGALSAAGVALAISVHGPLRTLETISNDHARAVQLASRIRSSMSNARRAVLAEVSAPPSEAAPVEGSRLYRAVQEQLNQLSRVSDTPFEVQKLDALRMALAQCVAEADVIDELVASGDREGARDKVVAFLDITGEANDAADAIVGFNADEVERSSRRVQRSIWILALTMLGLSLTAGAGAYVLLRFALRGLEAHEAIWHARFTDVDSFAARAAHELRTPLQTMKLAVASASPVALERARRSADRMSHTIDALLEFARAGVAPSPDASADVRRAVAEVQEELAPVIEQHHGKIDVHVESVSVGMALDHFRTIVRNLVGNALRHGTGPSGGRIGVRARAEDGWVRLEVKDDGPGIPPSALPHVFEPFARGTDAPGGYGVGLATVRRLVEGHGGTIAIESMPGCGTTVRVALPRRNVNGGERKPLLAKR